MKPTGHKISDRSLAALRDVYQRKRLATAARIESALAAMEAGRATKLPESFRWTKTALAKEAGIHVNTLLARGRDGELVFGAAIGRLEQVEARRNRQLRDSEAAKAQRHKSEVLKLIQERDSLLLRLEDMGKEIIAERELRLKAERDLSALKARTLS